MKRKQPNKQGRNLTRIAVKLLIRTFQKQRNEKRCFEKICLELFELSNIEPQIQELAKKVTPHEIHDSQN